MSLQVGAFCYATPADAGRAACSQFQNVSSVSGGTVQTVSCSGSDSFGNLFLSVSSVSVSGASSVQVVSQQVSFPPCVQQDYVDALEVVAGSILAVWVLIYTGHKILGLLGWSRGDGNA